MQRMGQRRQKYQCKVKPLHRVTPANKPKLNSEGKEQHTLVVKPKVASWGGWVGGAHAPVGWGRGTGQTDTKWGAVCADTLKPMAEY